MPTLFSGGYFSMIKGVIGPKFLDFLGDLEGASILYPPHSSYIQKPHTIRVN